MLYDDYLVIVQHSSATEDVKPKRGKGNLTFQTLGPIFSSEQVRICLVVHLVVSTISSIRIHFSIEGDVNLVRTGRAKTPDFSMRT